MSHYEKPVIVDYGTLVEMTAAAAAGTEIDADFPAGTPLTELTFSTPSL